MVLLLAQSGYEVTVVDDCSCGHRAAIEAVQRAVPEASIHFEECSLHDVARIGGLLAARRIYAVIHFAARASIAESFVLREAYWKNNHDGTLALLAAMRAAAVRRLIFSSTCATYGVATNASLPIAESCAQQPVNPYGESKLAAERAITAHHRAALAETSAFSYATLRYFNVVGSDPLGRIGEAHDPEHHLVPSCLLAALGRRGPVEIFGSDYPTEDGTCIRDYVDVHDVCTAHLAALNRLNESAAFIFNIGSGRGTSVREVVAACGRVAARAIPTLPAPRRAGDPPILIADAAEISRVWGWTPATVRLDESIANVWRWLSAHPNGYATIRRES